VHFLSLREVSAADIKEIIELGFKLKEERRRRVFKPYLAHRQLGMIFEKSSTRTRVSFEVGINELGGNALFLSSRDIQLGRGEPIRDTARVLSRMVDMVLIRTYEQERLEEFARFSSVPVINGLTDLCHPVQLLADLMTMAEFGKFDFKNPAATKVAYVGDGGNNMAHSWIMAAAKLGFELRIATPSKYAPNPKIWEEGLKLAKFSGAKLILTEDPREAVEGADVVTTDTWVSMGQEEEKEERIALFKPYQVDSKLMELANNPLFLHCLPAYRGFEVTEEVLEAHADEVFTEAENRLHSQKGLMVWIGNRSWK
jgi:ornithine carbamoyltransferase